MIGLDWLSKLVDQFLQNTQVFIIDEQAIN
jgi:hypothetical protein